MPALNLKLLWASILVPPGLAAVGMTIFAIAADRDAFMEIFFPIACAVVCVGTLGGWVASILALRQRFRGPSFVLLSLAYPLAQSTIIFTIFFAGCFVAIARFGY
ncbi:MAG: hypothetical protein HKO57_05785 [Akkermansiaceae bacterium]|nr:hypothetical protein [Akkermansiaceae bacterium]